MSSSFTEFVLNGLNQDITSSLATIQGQAVSDFECDAIAECIVLEADARATFKFQTDSFDLTNADASDIQYYVKSAGSYMGLGGSWNPMSGTTVAVKSGSETWGRAGTTNSDNQTYANLHPDGDYVRHLAWVLFSTHFGVDLFTNEPELVAALDSEMAGKVQAVFDAAASMTNATATDANLCRALMLQMIETNKERFVSLADSSGEQSLPLLAGDSISFRVIVRADVAQAAIVSLSAAANTRSSAEELDNLTLNKLDKVYKIKIKIE
jgi:hypothetical protein